ncbi:AMP-binding protein [Cellulomonas marina]|uniref:Long-chain acyl-CoA synthetase n=1 Tax=Cellulomonas marina TaxID=988821 RepID=A0A1I0YQ66_9CELL|nr:AMP-binding protein [Cellulomonas marina]GIG27574.1 long-chain-fatty-acid--CoA ligase [Cellulomonas marina]SFB15529.1 long-chain acyl-CoA synthetase [Cellulomonas marina]
MLADDAPASPTHGPRTVEVPDEALPAGLARAAARWPDRVALDLLGATTTYAELARQVERAAGALHALGVRPGDRVAVALPSCPAHVVAAYAVLRLGAVLVEQNPLHTAAELRHGLRDSGAQVAIVWERTLAAVLAARDGGEGAPELRTVVAVDLTTDLPRRARLALRLPVPAARRRRDELRAPVPAGIPSWHALVAAAAPLPADHPGPAPDDVALLQYTGGTTGTPKAAVLHHRHLVANAVQCAAWTGDPQGTETLYAVLPFFHAFGLTLCLFYGVRTGATLVLLPRFDPAMFLAAQRRRPGTFLPAVPPMLDRVAAAAEESGADLTSFRYAFSGAMALPAATAARWERLTGGLVVEGYGMTETGPVALGNPLSPARRPGALGLPFPSTDVRVVDPEDPDVDVPPGTQGELLVRGPQVFAGYWRRPEETAHQLLPGGWLRTGDLVRVEEDGFVVLVDRLKEMIVTGGFKVYPSQVEDHLRGMPGVRDVAVVGLPAGDLGEKVVAALVLEPGAPAVDLAAVRAWCGERLARYAVPRDLVVLPELPRSLIGKVLRRVVREQLLGEARPA